MNTISRSIGLDIIRFWAILFVIAEHFYLLNTPLRSIPFEGTSLFIQATALSLFFMAVPLFVILTGYLNIHKTCNKTYYKGIARVLISYLLFSVITILFRKYYVGETQSWTDWTMKILNFSAIPYGWYIEMWIGLFLLTPFLNILYENIGNAKTKLVLIGILFVITTLPHWTNRGGMHLLPDYWAKCWPLTLYFCGAYIREYQPRVNRWWASVAILLISLLNPVLNKVLGVSSLLLLGGGPEDVCSFAIAVLFFLICYRLQAVYCKGFVSKVSILSLDMYLCCYIFDVLYYPVFMDSLYRTQQQFGIIYFGPLVSLVFFSSFLVASGKKLIFRI